MGEGACRAAGDAYFRIVVLEKDRDAPPPGPGVGRPERDRRAAPPGPGVLASGSAGAAATGIDLSETRGR